MSMKPEIKAAWVAWLRDPNNKQGKGALRNGDNEYCCLGGLCELAVEAGVLTRTDIKSRLVSLYASANRSSDCSMSVLPWAAVHWAELDDTNPMVRYHADMSEEGTILSHLNDHEGLTFSQIADLIEEQL